MRPAILLAILLLALPLSLADSIVVQSPANDSSFDPARDRLTFRVDSAEAIESCTLHLDGEAAKTLTYGEPVAGKVLRYSATASEGTHTWRISCKAASGAVIDMPERVMHVSSEEQQVTVVPSGTFRGSYLHQFTLTDEKVVVPNVAAGDFLEIKLSVPPSTYTVELYVRNRLVDGGRQYLTIEQGRTQHKVFMDGNTTIELHGVPVVFRFTGASGNKNTIEVISPAAEACAQAITPAVDPQTGECREFPTPCDVPEGWEKVVTCGPGRVEQEPEESPEEPQESEEPAPQEEGSAPPKEPSPPTEAPEDEPEQNIFQRFFGWLSRLFG